ncbi:MAG: ribosomal protein S18-alanine N-acetyltransferase [Firmicutes bacterium]|nr:ribosomal protein S18-alanine N-acetyltransferase [Candidatus Caballimonas caccae]
MKYYFLEKKDAEEIFNLESASFNDGWNTNQIISAFSSGRYFSIGAKDNDKIVGFIGFSISLDTADIETVCVDKLYRKQGIGTELILRAERFLKEKNINKIFLEVRNSNDQAINLYIKSGFNKISIRKKYYSDGEDAIIMQKEI